MDKLIDVEKDPIRINKLFGQRASIGPIPASQVFPWIMIGAVSYFVIRMLFGGSYVVWICIWSWLAASWWILTGDRGYRFFKKWVAPPGEDWLNGETLFVPVTQPGLWKHRQQSNPKLIQVPTPQGVKRFMPFQAFAHIHSIAEIRMGGHLFACLLLYNPTTRSWSAQIPFKFQGLHPQLYRSEVESALNGMHRCMSEMIDNEYLTFHMSCSSSTRERIQELEELATQSRFAPISVMMFNEQRRVNDLAKQGTRQVWSQTIWGSWSPRQSTESRSDLIGQGVTWLFNSIQSFARSFTGTQQQHFETFYLDLTRQIYEYGYLSWRNLLETKSDLIVQPMSAQELWDWLWYRFNTKPYGAMPEIIRVREGEIGLTQHIPLPGQKDIITRLIQGEDGKSSCPQHRRQNGYIYANGRVGKVVVLEDPPDHWRSAREELRWIWSRISTSYVRDTEVVVQVSTRERWIVQDELEKMNRQSFTERRRAVEDGTGRVVHANLRDEYSSDALRKILEGRRPLHCAPIFIVWRESEQAADEAAIQICNAFESANAVVENDIAWRVWIESLPINDFSLLTKYAAFSERRITMDSETVAGFLPLTCPKVLHQRGVEFLTQQGGFPVHVDILSTPERLIITGATGSGKSVMGWRFIQDALAQGVPVVGIDLSTGGNSTFQTAIQILGEERAAYIDILQAKLNLVEPPDFRNLPPAAQLQRFKRWKDFVRQAIVSIAMGQITEQALLERVDAIVLRLLEVFLADAEMIERYNAAFEFGWKSDEWQHIPTLHDMLKFCSKDKLGLESFEDIDALAINQIVSQIGAKLVDPNIGDVIGRPSSVSPDPQIKFYALSGLLNESNSYIMAISAQMACLRNALAHPRSLFVGDELSVLLGKRGFAELVGEHFATGRKEGLSMLILAQDIDAIAECSAASKILANTSLTLTGYITHAATAAYSRVLAFPEEIISQNATEKFRSNRAEMYTRWLIGCNGRFWDTEFPAAPMMLAALANAEDEKMARYRILERYPKTERGYLQGLNHFTQEYVLALRGSKRLRDIGLSDFEQFQQRNIRNSA